MTVGEKIKILRIAADMTQEDLGKLLNVGKATIQKYECGNIQNLKTTHIKKLCEIFGKQPNYFFFDDAPPSDNEKLLDMVQNLFGETVKTIVENVVIMNANGQNKVLEYSYDIRTLNQLEPLQTPIKSE